MAISPLQAQPSSNPHAGTKTTLKRLRSAFYLLTTGMRAARHSTCTRCVVRNSLGRGFELRAERFPNSHCSCSTQTVGEVEKVTESSVMWVKVREMKRRYIDTT